MQVFFPRVSKMPNLTHVWSISVVIKERFNLALYTKYNVRDTEIVICIILVLLKKASGLNYQLIIR